MGRGTGSGLLGFGIVLILAGAIMRFAITVHSDGFDVNTAGSIVLLVGLVTAALGVILLVFGGRQHRTTREDIIQTPHGQERVQEQDEWSAP